MHGLFCLKNEHLAVSMSNLPHFVETFLSILAIGTQEQLKHQLINCSYGTFNLLEPTVDCKNISLLFFHTFKVY